MKNKAAKGFTAADLESLRQREMPEREGKNGAKRQTVRQLNSYAKPITRQYVNEATYAEAPVNVPLMKQRTYEGYRNTDRAEINLPTVDQLYAFLKDERERENLERERLERERLERERLERERLERERLERERLERERLERERLERERLERERLERERLERERLERERLERERLERERMERERLERERRKSERAEPISANTTAGVYAAYNKYERDLPTVEQLVELRAGEEGILGQFQISDLPTLSQLNSVLAEERQKQYISKPQKPYVIPANDYTQSQQTYMAAPRTQQPPIANHVQPRQTALDFAAEVRRKHVEESGLIYTNNARAKSNYSPAASDNGITEGKNLNSDNITESPAYISENTEPVEGLPTVDQLKKQLDKNSGKKKRRRDGDEPTGEQLIAAHSKIRYRRNFLRVLKNTIFTLITVSAVAVLVAVLLLPVLRIYGTSMSPTLDESNLVLSIKGSSFDTGDVIAFYYNNKILVKRVIAQSGDWVDIDKDGSVSVNGEQLDEPYVSEKSFGECDIELPYQVPEGRVFVMGDHRGVSIDSRNSTIGCVAEEQIVGKIVYCVWPLDSFGPINK